MPGNLMNKVKLIPGFINEEFGVAVLGFWTVRTVLNPISGQDFDAGHDESGVLHSARWHDGDWMFDGIRKAWLWCFVWMENFQSLLTLLRAYNDCSLIGCWVQ
ncbi:uncharacterized protein TNCV_3568711 [Trichonephila clavipes]|nr:uncharacterized protein TNCV_3568711 [Trichonephila clavipes]